MTISMYNASIPGFIKGLESLLAILSKAEAYAAGKKIDPLVLTSARLAPDMFPLTKQVQIATDMVKGFAARMSGVDIPKYEDSEKTFPELQARINKTIAFLKSVDAKAIDASEGKAVQLKFGPKEFSFNGLPYLISFVIPNFYFHVTAAYAILRHNGLDIGKADFLGNV